jgi:hypothetical protein
MEILRIPPYPLSIEYAVPTASTSYFLVISSNDRNEEIVDVAVTSNASAVISRTLDDTFSNYDDHYAVTIYEKNGTSRGDIVVEDNLEIVRPYVDPNSLGTTATEIAEYTEYEKLARQIIDSYVPDGFYFTTEWLQTVGQGTDYMPLWIRGYKVLKVYENAEKVWDVDDADGPALDSFDYSITKDKTGIIKDPTAGVDNWNRYERKPAKMAIAASDSISWFDTEDSGNIQTFRGGVSFPEGTDYMFYIEAGYKVVPNDIKDATNMLIDDIKCGKLDYYKRYVDTYKTDQFNIRYNKTMIEGTGNLLVDKILNKYVNQITRPGVL